MLFCFHFSIGLLLLRRMAASKQLESSLLLESLCGMERMERMECVGIDLDRFGSIWIDLDRYPLPLLEGFSDLLAFAPRSHRFLLVGRTFSFHVWMPRVTLGFYYFSNGLVECEPIFDLPTFFCHWLAWTCSSLSPLAQQHFCVLLQHHGWKLKAGRHRAHSLGASHLYI